MPWPSLAFWRQKPTEDHISSNHDDPRNLPTRISDKLPRDSSSSPNFTTTQTVLISLATTGTTLALFRLYKTYLRRTPNIAYLNPSSLRNRSYYGYVTRVGDGDNFHLFHTPGGRLTGWGWAPRRGVKDMMSRAAKGKGEQTMHIRLAGVDAPEMSHFGRPEQPYAREALEWLKGFVGGKFVRVYPFRQDQYQRVVSAAYIYRWGFWKTDVGLSMLKRGLATVYEAKFGSEFGNQEQNYRAAEERAKQRKVGMWQESGLIQKLLGRDGGFESPREYKSKYKQTGKEEKK